MNHLRKFVRTPHLEGSRLQAGDSCADQAKLSSLSGLYAVIEEKVDGGNSGISFNAAAELLLQCRGHYLVGGYSERQFNLMKPWARCHESTLLEILEDRFVCYGEWCYAKHSCFADQLAHYFNEFDILDLATDKFLSTKRRREMLKGSPILSVPVLYEGPMPTNPKHLWSLVRHSLTKSATWRQSFENAVKREGLDLDLAWKQTDTNDKSEGLYIKIEDDDHVLARYKLVRHDFVQTILDSDSHHTRRPIIPNQLAAGVDIYAPVPTVTWEDLGLKTMHSLEEIEDSLSPSTGARARWRSA